jgi:hypothetical protein
VVRLGAAADPFDHAFLRSRVGSPKKATPFAGHSQSRARSSASRDEGARHREVTRQYGKRHIFEEL